MSDVTCPQPFAHLYNPAMSTPSASALSHRCNAFPDPFSPSACTESSVTNHVVLRLLCSWRHPCRRPLGLSHRQSYQRRRKPPIYRLQGRGPSTRRRPWFSRMVRSVVTTLYELLRLTLPPRAMIKTAPPGDLIATENLCREFTRYRLPGVSSAACFRQMYDEINNCTLAGEWLDTTLAEVKYRPDMPTYALIRSFLDAALASCDVLDHERHVNTGTVPILRDSTPAY